MEDREYTYTYVPDFITEKWSKDGSSVMLLDARDCSVIEDDFRNIYWEKYFISKPVEEITNHVLFDEKKLVDNLNKVVNGDYLLLETIEKDIAALASMLFYTNPFSPWRMSRILAEEKNIKDEVKAYEYLYSAIKSGRNTSELIDARYMSSFMAAYMYDLKPALLEAPSGSSFVLGYNPLLTLNFFECEKINPSVSFFRNGTIMFITISPKYAVCLYDSFVYRPKKTDGRIVLSKKEVLDINMYMMSGGSDIIFYPDGECDETYFTSLMKASKESRIYVSEFDLPSFRLISRAYAVQNIETRAYPGLLNMYDTSPSRERINFAQRNEFIEKLLKGDRSGRNL